MAVIIDGIIAWSILITVVVVILMALFLVFFWLFFAIKLWYMKKKMPKDMKETIKKQEEIERGVENERRIQREKQLRQLGEFKKDSSKFAETKESITREIERKDAGIIHRPGENNLPDPNGDARKLVTSSRDQKRNEDKPRLPKPPSL